MGVGEGDIEENLQRLAVSLVQEHPVAEQLRQLMRMEYPVHDLRDLVRLFTLIRWSTKPVEQYHGSASVLKRYHPGYSVEFLCLRSVCHQLWPLCQPPKLDARIRALDNKHTRLARKCPERLSGLNVLARNTAHAGAAHADARTRDAVRLQMFGHAARTWHGLSRHTQAEYTLAAMQERLTKRHELNEELQRVRQERADRVRFLRARREEMGCTGGVDDTRFGEADMRLLEGLFTSSEFDNAALERTAADIARPPTVPDEESRFAIMQQPHFVRSEHGNRHQWWLSPMAHARKALAECAVRLGSAEGDPWFLCV